MIDHVILIVSDFERSVASYAKALKPLGITNLVTRRKIFIPTSRWVIWWAAFHQICQVEDQAHPNC
jgi:hypothetical protein